uniref:Uncharacterized protein n=1 Tax=Zea mays TaxID=4577 RepID=B6SX77_MAIZE|nr:hypothetical protein [Zea mays]
MHDSFIAFVLRSGSRRTTQALLGDGAGAGDLAAARGPRRHRRHHPLHHLPLIADDGLFSLHGRMRCDAGVACSSVPQLFCNHKLNT